MRWVDGDLALPHLDLCDEAPLEVAGSLEVAGALLDASYPLSMLVILRDLTAGKAITRGELHVAGNAAMRGLWYLNSGNDYRARVLGDAAAEVFVEDGMHVLVGGTLEGRTSSRDITQSRAARGCCRTRDRSRPRPLRLLLLRGGGGGTDRRGTRVRGEHRAAAAPSRRVTTGVIGAPWNCARLPDLSGKRRGSLSARTATSSSVSVAASSRPGRDRVMRYMDKDKRLALLTAPIVGLVVTVAIPASVSTSHEFVNHIDGARAGEVWFNSSNHAAHHGHPERGFNSFTIKDLFCGDG